MCYHAVLDEVVRQSDDGQPDLGFCPIVQLGTSASWKGGGRDRVGFVACAFDGDDDPTPWLNWVLARLEWRDVEKEQTL